jgi:hypothetical protein
MNAFIRLIKLMITRPEHFVSCLIAMLAMLINQLRDFFYDLIEFFNDEEIGEFIENCVIVFLDDAEEGCFMQLKDWELMDE